MKSVLQVMLKASNMVPLSGAMVQCRGLALVGGMPLVFPGIIPVGRGVVRCVRESAPTLAVRRPLLLPGNILVGPSVIGLVKESTLTWGLGTVVAVGCRDLGLMVYLV